MVEMLLLSPATSTWRDDLQAANGMTCYRSEKNTIVPTSYIEEFRGTAQHQNGEDDQQRQETGGLNFCTHGQHQNYSPFRRG